MKGTCVRPGSRSSPLTTIAGNVFCALAVALGVGLAGAFQSLSAQPASAQATPATVARDAFDHLEAGRWGEFVDILDPLSVARFREEQLEHAQAWETQSVVSRARSQPLSAPACVTQYFEALRAAQPDVNPALSSLAGVKTMSELLALSARETLVRWLEASHGRGLDDTSETRRAILGAVQRGDSVAHVVYQLTAQDPEEPTIHVITVRRRPAGWRVVLNEEILEEGGAAAVGPLN